MEMGFSEKQIVIADRYKAENVSERRAEVLLIHFYSP